MVGKPLDVTGQAGTQGDDIPALHGMPCSHQVRQQMTGIDDVLGHAQLGPDVVREVVYREPTLKADSRSLAETRFPSTGSLFSGRDVYV